MQIPPCFNDKCELFEWRKHIVKWASIMKAATELGEDRSYKANFIIICVIILYNHALSIEERNLIDEAKEKNIINYIQTGDPIKAALDIVRIIAVYPPIVRAGRLINSFQHD